MTHHDFRRQIDQLKATISLKELVERDGHKMVRSGPLWKCCCPFHQERNPSFTIYEEPHRSHFYCFGCAVSGDLFGYMMKRDGCDFKTAVERLSNGSLPIGRTVIRRVAVKKEPELPRDYFKKMISDSICGEQVERLAVDLGVTFDSLWRLWTTWSETHAAFAFPMSDHTGHIIGIRLRQLSGQKLAIKGSKQGLFIPRIGYEYDLYVTEGPTDCAALLSMGLFAIGKASAMQGPEEIVKFIQKNRIRRVIVIADNDTAGLNGAKKLIDACPVPCCELVLPAKDAREFYRNGGTRELIENLLKSVVWRTK